MTCRYLIAAALASLPAAVLAQTPPTHVAMDALLNMRFFPQQGSFMMAESVPVLFPPPGETPATIVIKKGGAAVLTKKMVIEPWPPHNAFGNLRAGDGMMGFGQLGAGDYTFNVELKGKTISSYPFSIVSEKSADPFDPKTEMVRTGPWSKAAFLIGPVNDTGADIRVGIWLSTRELPGYAPNKQIPITMHLMSAGKQMALFEGVVTDNHWQQFRLNAITAHGMGPVKWAKLIATPGAYTLEYRAAGKVIRTYKFNVAGGKIARIPQNEVGYEGADALPPQSLMADTRVEQYWLAPLQ